MERNLFKYILRHSRRDQVIIILIVIVSQLFYFLSLDLPKTIVNKAIQGEGFDTPGATAPFLRTVIGLPDFLGGGSFTLFDGLDLERIPYLVALCLIFLLLVLINGGFKYQINTQKGRMGERMLRRLRYELFDRILRFPPWHLRKVKQAEAATMIKDEVEPLGGFIGDAFVQPVFLGGQALTALVFIVAQSFWLGMVTVAILALQGFIIPKLRKRILVLGKQRQLTARQLAGRIAECVDGATEIHVNDTSNRERADIVDRLGLIYRIRFEIYQRKFAVKFLNNTLAQVTPFLFFLIGGYLAITGRLDIGGLVAVIGAYKDLPGPIKELIDWDQQRQAVQISYEQVVEQFSPAGMLPESLQDPTVEAAQLEGPVAINNLVVAEEGEGKLLDGISLTFPLEEHVAVTGQTGGGKEVLALVLARLVWPTQGSVQIGGRDLMQLPEAVTGRRLSYVGQDCYLFPTSVRDNLVYGLKHRPLREPPLDEAARRRRAQEAAEARRAGNPYLDLSWDWVEYEAAGTSGPEDLDSRLVEVLETVELEEDTYQFGLRGTIDPERRPELAASIIQVREALRGRLAEPALAALIEPFDAARYNRNMSVAENLLFGTPVGGAFATEKLGQNAHVRETLNRAGVMDPLLAMGQRIAETMVELFADLPPGHPFFEQFSFIAAEDLPEFRALLARIGASGPAGLPPDDRAKLLGLAFPYVEARHRLTLIDAAMERRLLEARRAFAENLPPDLAGAVEFYDEKRYNAAATLQDNILFGRLVYGQAQAAARIGQAIVEVLTALDLRGAVLGVGLDYQVGVAGRRLTGVQRQKLGLARALVKRPDLLIVNEATAVFDAGAQGRVMDRIVAQRAGSGIVWVLHRPDLARKMHRVLVLRDGKIVEQGKVSEMDRPGTAFTDLLAAE